MKFGWGKLELQSHPSSSGAQDPDLAVCSGTHSPNPSCPSTVETWGWPRPGPEPCRGGLGRPGSSEERGVLSLPHRKPPEQVGRLAAGMDAAPALVGEGWAGRREKASFL